ncbi:hypothetical protein FRC06_001030 [Ceratobasidium sp. 370]|nr:hypothetical protein FRC06_001030 [Ceratobasidium sp. 370]
MSTGLGPPGNLSGAVAHWKSLRFGVIPGGQHAHGLASNALVPLAYGVCVEHFAFEKSGDARELGAVSSQGFDAERIENTETHPDSALGISHIHLSVPEDVLSQVRAQLSVVLGGGPDESTEWELALPRPIKVQAPRLRSSAAGSGVTVLSIEEVQFFVGRAKDEVDAPEGFGKFVCVETNFVED